jgi:hypothetical protein
MTLWRAAALERALAGKGQDSQLIILTNSQQPRQHVATIPSLPHENNQGDTMSKKPRRARTGAATKGSTSYHPNEHLARAIVKAWSDESFKNRLLTFPPGAHEADWKKIPEGERSAMLRKTSAALAEMDVFLDTPVVLTVEQFATYKGTSEKTEAVFVLPDVLGKKISLATAQVAMAMQMKGI